MTEAQAPGMQHRPWRLAWLATAVLDIARQRVSKRGEMYADLVRAPGVQVTAQECMRAPSLEHCVPGASETPCSHHGHALAIPRMPADWTLELSGLRFDDPAHYRLVGAAQRPIAQLRGQGPVRHIVSGHDHEAAGSLVQPVHDARALLAAGSRPGSAPAEHGRRRRGRQAERGCARTKYPSAMRTTPTLTAESATLKTGQK